MNRRVAQVAGVEAVVVVVALIAGAFTLGMYRLLGESTEKPALGPGYIAFVSFREGDFDIYVMNADGSSVVRLAEGYSPAWSPLLD